MAARVGLGSERGVVIHGAYLCEACVPLEWLQAQRIEHAVLAHPSSAELRTRASAKLVRLSVDCGLLTEAPAL